MRLDLTAAARDPAGIGSGPVRPHTALSTRASCLRETALRTVQFLYVEDNDDLRESICSLMEAPSRAITACASAEAALAVMAETADMAFDALITDVNLPGMSGMALAKQWLALRPATWVVLCSGYEFNHGLAHLGPNVRSLPKAFEIEELEALLDEIEAAVR